MRETDGSLVEPSRLSNLSQKVIGGFDPFFPQADRSRLQNLKCSEIALDFFKLAIEQKLDRIYQLANHRVSTGTQETNSKTIRPLTPVEKEILKKIPKIFCVNMCVESPKNHPSTRLLGYILNELLQGYILK